MRKIERTIFGSCVLIGLATVPAIAAWASDADFKEAETAAQSGLLADMQVAYESILQQAPDNIRALNGKATALAWQAKYASAQATYEKVLILDERNTDALVGLGYAYARDKQYV